MITYLSIVGCAGPPVFGFALAPAKVTVATNQPERLLAQYDAMWRDAAPIVRAGDAVMDPTLGCPTADPRRGITLLARPVASVSAALVALSEELRTLDRPLCGAALRLESFCRHDRGRACDGLRHVVDRPPRPCLRRPVPHRQERAADRSASAIEADLRHS